MSDRSLAGAAAVSVEVQGRGTRRSREDGLQRLGNQQPSDAHCSRHSTLGVFRDILEPVPFYRDSSLVNVGQSCKDVDCDINICRFTARASIHDRQVDAPVISSRSNLLPTQGVVVWTTPGTNCVEYKVGDGDNFVIVGGGDATGAQSRGVVGKISSVWAASA